MIYGYARVSTAEQETHLQLDALAKHPVEKIFEEKRSGASLERRPMLAALLDQLRPGDTFVVYKLDRVARSLKDLLSTLDRIKSAGAGFVSLTEQIDTTTPAGRMMMQMLGAFAEFERSMIAERTKAGMRAAMKRGIEVGRPRGLPPIMESAAVNSVLVEGKSKSQVARDFGVHISSIKRAIVRHQTGAQ